MPSEYDLWDMIPKKTDETWELAYYGGTFTSLPRSVMLRYLEFGQKLRRKGRIGSIRISTHPAYLDQEKISLLRRYGVSTVELGVQSMDDFVLEKAGRDHGKGEIIHSITLLKDAGFTVGIQLMTGLPGQFFREFGNCCHFDLTWFVFIRYWFLKERLWQKCGGTVFMSRKHW